MTDSGGIDSNFDDLSIQNSDQIWRRIPPHHLVFDENSKQYRPSSAAFEDHPGGSPMSAQLASVLQKMGISPEAALTHYPDFGIASLSVGLLRDKGQTIYFQPQEDQPGHVEISGSKTKSIRRFWAKECQLLVVPDKNR